MAWQFCSASKQINSGLTLNSEYLHGGIVQSGRFRHIYFWWERELNLSNPKQNMSQEEIIEKLTNQISEDDDLPLAVSAIVMGNSIGYPRRLVEENGEIREGELEGFDELYDYAQDILQTEDLTIEKDEQYIWFKKSK